MNSAFVPDGQREAPARKSKEKAHQYEEAGDSGREEEHVYVSQIVEITTDTRQDEPMPVPLVRATH